jgi:hypothetical protein
VTKLTRKAPITRRQSQHSILGISQTSNLQLQATQLVRIPSLQKDSKKNSACKKGCWGLVWISEIQLIGSSKIYDQQ